MTTVNPTTGISYDPTLTSYNSDLALLAENGFSTGSTDTSAYTLDGSLPSLGQTAATIAAAQTSTTGINPAAYSLPSAFTNPDLLNQITPGEISYLLGLPTSQSSTASSVQPTSEATSSDLYAANPAGVTPLGDPINWQIGDDELYQLDPSLAAIVGGATSSGSSSAYNQDQDTSTVGTAVDTSA
jgi:hypothetical protein